MPIVNKNVGAYSEKYNEFFCSNCFEDEYAFEKRGDVSENYEAVDEDELPKNTECLGCGKKFNLKVVQK